jgi:hypothetical protein
VAIDNRAAKAEKRAAEAEERAEKDREARALADSKLAEAWQAAIDAEANAAGDPGGQHPGCRARHSRVRVPSASGPGRSHPGCGGGSLDEAGLLLFVQSGLCR